MASEPPKPNIDPGRVISRAFETLTAKFLPFFAIALLLLGVPVFLGQYLALSAVTADGPLFNASPDGVTGDPLFFLSAAYWVPVLSAALATVLGYVLLQVMLTRSTILHLSGRETDLAGSFMLGLRLLLPVIGLAICVGFLLIIGFILLIVPAIMIWCALIVSLPVLVEERGGVFASIGRSRELTRGSRWQIFMLVVLTWIFSMVVSGLTGVITGTTASFSGVMAMPDPILAGVVNGIGSTLTGLIGTVIVAALYVELREVKEGAATSDLADVFG